MRNIPIAALSVKLTIMHPPLYGVSYLSITNESFYITGLD